MSSIKLHAGESLRLDYHQGNFVDVCWANGYDHYGLEIRSLDGFNSWAIIKTDEYSPHRLICFPDDKWLNEWIEYEQEHGKPFEVVYKPHETLPSGDGLEVQNGSLS